MRRDEAAQQRSEDLLRKSGECDPARVAFGIHEVLGETLEILEAIMIPPEITRKGKRALK
jgi:hypothetical protein